MPIEQSLADEGPPADVFAEALRREVAAALGLLATTSRKGSGQVLMPLGFRFALIEPASRRGDVGHNREIVVSVSAGGLETVDSTAGPARLWRSTDGR